MDADDEIAAREARLQIVELRMAPDIAALPLSASLAERLDHPGTASSLIGAMICAPATPGISEISHR